MPADADPIEATDPEPGLSVADQLALERRGQPGQAIFTSVATTDMPRMFGGALLGQALRAAQATVDPARSAHTIQAVFVEAADGRRPVRYEVDVTRDGSSFSTRRVTATQDGSVALTLTAGFHADEPGPTYELDPSVPAPPPDGLAPGRYSSPWFDSRDVPRTEGLRSPHGRRTWFRSRRRLPDDLSLHAAALAYLSDYGHTRAVRTPHRDHPGLEQRRSVSLDHAMWMHRPARVDSWLLSELMPVFTGSGRGLALGTIRTPDGQLVATVAQQTLFRVPG